MDDDDDDGYGDVSDYEDSSDHEDASDRLFAAWLIYQVDTDFGRLPQGGAYIDHTLYETTPSVTVDDDSIA